MANFKYVKLQRDTQPLISILCHYWANLWKN